MSTLKFCLEMKVVWILITWACLSMGQLIYPDEFESMVAKTQTIQSITRAPSNSFAYSSGSLDHNGVNALSSSSLQTAQAPKSAQAAVPNISLDPVWSNRANSVISKGVLRFALNMDNAVSVSQSRFVPGSRENVVFSPLSVAAALSLVLLGSAGKTFAEVSSILGLNAGVDISRNSEVVHQMFGILIDAIVGNSASPATQTYFASGIFVRDGYPIRPEFSAVSESVYKSEVINLDFSNGGRSAQAAVNAWVNNRTRGKIPSILSDALPGDTSVIIASALYFNGEWNQYFFNGATRRRTFTVAPGETVEVDMMYNGGEFPFFEDKRLRAKILGLPYKGREVTMYIVLPTDKGIDALRTLERQLDADTVENLIGNMRNQTCIVGLPRMKLSSTLSLRGALQSLGLVSLFDSQTADLSLLSPGYSGESLAGVIRTPTNKPPTTGSDGFSFPSRVGEGEGGDTNKPRPRPPFANGLRQNFFSYDDKLRGYHVEQWATGFTIGRIQRARKRRNVGEEEKTSADNFEEKNRENSKTSSDRLQRSRRQVRPIDQNFLNYIVNQNQPSYGLDYLRNNVPLVNPRLFADDVLHRVEIDVTEKGTEAAAATVVALNKDGSQKRLVADHPFLFFIRHEETGLLLFWGTVNKPTPNYSNQTNTS